jgi:UPF0755 protein
MMDRFKKQNTFAPNPSWAGISKINKVENVKYKQYMLILKIGAGALVLAGVFVFFAIQQGMLVHGGGKPFIIQDGESVAVIAQHLKERGAISNETVFKAFVLARRVQGKLKSGEYTLKNGDLSSLIDLFAQGVKPREVSLTFLEGWTIDDMDAYLLEKGLIRPGEFSALALREYLLNGIYDVPDSIIEENKSKGKEISADDPDALKSGYSLEGYLFPDTYRFFADATPYTIIKKMLFTFDKKFTREMRDAVNFSGKSIEEIVVMASLLEKEVRTYEDKTKVSDIFWRRIEKGMPLQADATVNYVIKGTNPSLTLEQTRIDSRYNTYKYTGLPIGPISNPGIDSLKAAIYPESNGFWYYLSSPEGTTIFSKTLEEHNINKQKYLK